MSDLYLIAHKVRGSAAFDIATRCECPECIAMGCPECDDLGYWWIVPTSGHRAYPYWHRDLMEAKWGLADDCLVYEGFSWEDISDVGTLPEALPDHYPHREAPTLSLTEALGLAKPTPSAPIVRRF